VSAKTGVGVPELLGELERHREYAETHPDEDEKRRRARDEVLSIVRERAADHVIASLLAGDILQEAITDVKERRVDPYTSVERLLSSAATNPLSGSEEGGELKIGLTHVYTGDGKGKTSAALGLALRAVGRGLRVHVVQFLKGHRDYGEHIVAKRIPGLEITACGRGEYIEGSPTPRDMALAAEALERAREIIGSGDYNIVVLDEVNVALELGLIEKDAILEIIDSKPGNLELVLTGRGAPPEIVEAADLVTEMREVKHPFGKGVKARKGIEY
jgi:cob(I)alamin adenosyltransferase